MSKCFCIQLFELPVYKDCKEANMINIKKTLEKEVKINRIKRYSI